MTFEPTSIILAVLALAVGLGLGYLIRRLIADSRIRSAENKVQNILNDAKSKAQDLLLEAKNKSLQILEESKKEGQERHAQLLRIEKILEKKEGELESKSKDLDREKHLLKNKVEEGNKETVEKKAREIMTMAIQRYAGSHISDITTTVVTLPSDELKGKIIGKEGRNIKTIERLTGVDVIIDDTPETLILSSFDPVRRHTAKLVLEKLIADGRIHPAKIEEFVEKAKTEINEKIKEAGEAALFETGVGPEDPKLTFLLGRLAFRTSFGQNVLIHSIEMTHVSGIMAQELGADVSIAKKGALFHDIGKAVDHEVQGTHVEIGRKILAKFNVDEKVILAMQSHHEEYTYTTLESRIVQAADAISAARD